jgi:HEAT repeat protein
LHAVLPLLGDACEIVRCVAVRAAVELAAPGDIEVVASLSGRLAGLDSVVRTEALDALSELACADHESPCSRSLCESITACRADDAEEVRHGSCKALAAISCRAESCTASIRMLVPFLRHVSECVRLAAVEALGGAALTNDAETLALLIPMLQMRMQTYDVLLLRTRGVQLQRLSAASVCLRVSAWCGSAVQADSHRHLLLTLTIRLGRFDSRLCEMAIRLLALMSLCIETYDVLSFLLKIILKRSRSTSIA